MSLTDKKNCQDYLEKKESQWESLCIRCGGCCGAYDDPCIFLKKSKKDGFYCSIYNNRFGSRKALSGEEFDCVPVKEILCTHWKNDHLCSYKKYLKTPWLFDTKILNVAKI